MIERPKLRRQIEAALRRSQVVALIGPRQSGKTTMARQFVAPDSVNYFDLEDPSSLARVVVRETSCCIHRAAIHTSFSGRGRPFCFRARRIRAYTEVVDSSIQSTWH